MQLDLFREIIVDNFAGGGGASTGIEMATGLSVDIAINHDPKAIEMHKLNHPDTEHYCENVWDVNPKEAVKGRKVGLAWFSPDCTHHSKAKGGKPVEQSIRGLAWIAVNWAIQVKPRVIMLENVEEFRDWCPLNEKGRPIVEQKGKTFHSFVKALESLGYEVQFKELQACDFGAPTTRKRFFMIARCDGKEIVWPEPTHAPPGSLQVRSGRKLPYRTASEIIDWDIGVPSIFSRKRPLVENTLKRIERGLKKFVLESDNPFVVDGDKAAYLISYYTEQSSKEVRGLSLDTPLHTITAGGNRFALVYAWLTKYYGGDDQAQSLHAPLHTIRTKDCFALTTMVTNGHVVTDIGMRMLKPHELYAAQGFPKSYNHTHYSDGKKIPQNEQIKRCGNSVPPPFAEVLVRANLPEFCKNNKMALAR